MSISSRLEAINTHLLDDYSVLTLAGADLTNVNKNIVNLKQQWQERLLYFMNNGTSVVWNNWNKVTGTGTTLSLNNTVEAPMSLIYKGNTSQEGTPTPSNPISVNTVSGDNSINVMGDTTTNNMWNEQWELGGINNSTGALESANNFIRTKDYIVVKPSTTYYRTATASESTRMFYYTENKTYISNEVVTVTGGTFTTPNNAKYMLFKKYATTYSNDIAIYEGNTAKNYQPYTGASYPINLGVENLVKFADGAGTINNINVSRYNQEIKLNQTATSGTYTWLVITKDSFNLHSGTPSSANIISYANGKTISTGIVNKNIKVLSGTSTLSLTSFNIYDETGTVITTPTSTTNVVAVGIYLGNGQTFNNFTFKVELIKGNTTQYVSETPIELNKISTYQDYIFKSSGKNLIQVADISGSLSNQYYKDYATGFTLEAGQTYTLSLDVQTGVTTFLITAGCGVSGYARDIYTEGGKNNGRVSITFTPTSTQLESGTQLFIRCPRYNTAQTTTFTLKNIQLEKGQITNPTYEPYGTDWYKYSAIGKKSNLLSDFVSVYTSYTNLDYIRFLKPSDSATKGNSTNIPAFLTSGKYAMNYNFNNPDYINFFSPNGEYNNFWFGVTKGTTTEQAQTILTNGTIYYPLAIPTYDKITDTSLINQLEALKKSYDTQTNISQTNNDLPFELCVTALGVE